MTVSNGKSVESVIDGIFEAAAAFDGSISRLDDLEVAKQQALAALEEIMVAAKPQRQGLDEFSGGFKNGVNQYEQNLLQALSNNGKE